MHCIIRRISTMYKIVLLLFKIVLDIGSPRIASLRGLHYPQYGGKANNESGMFGETNFTFRLDALQHTRHILRETP